MKKLYLVSFILLCAIGCAGPKSPVLTIEGGKIQGVPTETAGVTVYKGIPYAAAPLGDLRWKAPQPVTPWEGVRVADTFGAPSLQAPHSGGGYTPEFFFEGDPEFSEDCLYLNVWTPAAGKENAKLPVCLWVHGGGYMAGWGSEPEMNGEEWAAHGVVLVTFNYRLGSLGFLAHPALSAENPDHVSGNYGTLDQIEALKWVKRNIAQFGGDPEHVTVMGQSAGGFSIKTLVTSPLSKGLISGAIIQSAGGLSDSPQLGGMPLEQAESDGAKLMDWAGYDTLEKMRAAPADAFVGLPFRYMAEKQEYLRGGSAPVTDGVVLPSTFDQAALTGEIADVPYMIGGTLDDMQGLDAGITRFCLQREKDGGVAYAYHFDRRLPTDGRPDVLEGAFHSSELWYMFKSLRFCWRPFTPGDYALSEQMITAWTNFVKTGNPGNGWTPCTEEDPSFMIFKLDESDAVSSEMGRPDHS